MQGEVEFLTALRQELERISQNYREADLLSRDQIAPLAELSATLMMRADELRAAVAEANADAV